MFQHPPCQQQAGKHACKTVKLTKIVILSPIHLFMKDMMYNSSSHIQVLNIKGPNHFHEGSR